MTTPNSTLDRQHLQDNDDNEYISPVRRSSLTSIMRKGFGFSLPVVWEMDNLSRDAKALYHYLQAFTPNIPGGRLGKISRTKILRDLSMSKKLYHKCLKSLENNHLISREQTTRKDGKKSVNIFMLYEDLSYHPDYTEIEPRPPGGPAVTGESRIAEKPTVEGSSPRAPSGLEPRFGSLNHAGLNRVPTGKGSDKDQRLRSKKDRSVVSELSPNPRNSETHALSEPLCNSGNENRAEPNGSYYSEKLNNADTDQTKDARSEAESARSEMAASADTDDQTFFADKGQADQSPKPRKIDPQVAKLIAEIDGLLPTECHRPFVQAVKDDAWTVDQLVSEAKRLSQYVYAGRITNPVAYCTKALQESQPWKQTNHRPESFSSTTTRQNQAALPAASDSIPNLGPAVITSSSPELLAWMKTLPDDY
jgi:hypothetical protein